MFDFLPGYVCAAIDTLQIRPPLTAYSDEQFIALEPGRSNNRPPQSVVKRI
jgi:hypothetical protein